MFPTGGLQRNRGTTPGAVVGSAPSRLLIGRRLGITGHRSIMPAATDTVLMTHVRIGDRGSTDRAKLRLFGCRSRSSTAKPSASMRHRNETVNRRSRFDRSSHRTIRLIP
jgi:hypothetical protein